MAGLVLDGIGKQYPGGQMAVRGASFSVADGELLVLVGPSGCGKSTLLRMIAGLESITTGTLKIGDQVVNDVPPSDRDIAMVFQSYALYPHMTVAQNLGFGLKLRGHTREQIAERVGEAAATLELGPLLDRKPAALSGGQRQRVALGRALVRKPQVFLLDEPLSNLDAKLRMTMRVEIARLHRQLGTTMVYVTHDQIEAMTLGQRIVVLKDGEIQQIDTPMALYERPANLFVAGFLGSPAMNLLRGRLECVQDSQDVVIALPEGQNLPLGAAAVAGSWVGQEVVAGIRPEDLCVDDGANSFPVDVEVVEPVGNEVFVNLRHGPNALVARFAPRPLPVAGTSIRVAVQPRHLHFFDAGTGTRLDLAG